MSSYGQFTYHKIKGTHSDTTIEVAIFKDKKNEEFLYFPLLNMVYCDYGSFDLRILSGL
ncbi:hypothetical protein NUSPORA_02658 [Nucleospora cyclopteri]